MEQPSTVERLLNWSVEPLMQRCEDERMEKEGIHSTPEGRNVHVGHAGVLHDTFSSSSFPSVTVYAVSIASHRIASHRFHAMLAKQDSHVYCCLAGMFVSSPTIDRSHLED